MLGEIAAPLVPEFAGLLVALTLIAATLVAIGIITVLNAFARAVVGGMAALLGRIPGVGGVLASPANAVVHWMGAEFGKAEASLDGLLARFLHELGILIAWTMHEIRDLSKLVYTITTVMVGTAAIEAVHALIRYVEGRVHGAELAIGRVLHRIGTIEGRIITKVDHWVEPRLHAVEHLVDGVIEHDIASLRARARAITHSLDNLWQRVRHLDALLSTAAFAAAVAVALGTLDLNWIRCRNWGRIGRGVCGLPAELLDALLLGAIDAFVLTDLCDLSSLMIAAAEELRPALLAFVDVEEALVGCRGNTAPPSLGLAPLRLPPVAARLSLAA
jgi:hypothetical protein